MSLPLLPLKSGSFPVLFQLPIRLHARSWTFTAYLLTRALSCATLAKRRFVGERLHPFTACSESVSFPTHSHRGRPVILARQKEACMPLTQPPYHEPSPDVLDLLKEEMRRRFPLVQHRHPDLITTRVHGDKVCVDLWSTSTLSKGLATSSERWNSGKSLIQLLD